MQYCACVCEKLSKNTGNGALCRMSFGSQPQRKELSGGCGDGGSSIGGGGSSSRLSCFCLLASIGANMLSQASFTLCGPVAVCSRVARKPPPSMACRGPLTCAKSLCAPPTPERRTPPPMYVRRPCVHNECGSIFLYILLQRQQSCRRNVRHAQRCA